jgi:putative metallohydrolase (TIGR04338 family)
MTTIDFAPGRALLPEGRTLRVYRAEDLAALHCPAPELDGSLAAAQRYADKVTRSAWWSRNVGDGRNARLRESRGAGSAYSGLVRYRGRYYHDIRLGTSHGRLDGTVRPTHIADPWVVLHELAHAGSPEDPGHGREFARVFLGLVRRFLGPEAGTVLLAAYRQEGVKYLARRGG